MRVKQSPVRLETSLNPKEDLAFRNADDETEKREFDFIMSTPGLLFVTSQILDRNKTPDELYNRFCDEEHLPDVLNYIKAKADMDRPLAL